MVELRKRQLPFPTSDKPAKTLKTTPVSLDNEFSDNKSSNKPPPLQTGDTIPDLAQFGNSILLQTGESTTFESILSKSKKGVVVFTYPKANTPGCTTQACSFNTHSPFITSDSSGLDIYGLSRDSPVQNTKFKEKYGFGYDLLCDTKGSLVDAFGLGSGGKTQRGVVVVSKEGKVLEKMVGGPAKTVDVVLELVKRLGEGGGNATKGEDDVTNGKDIDSKETIGGKETDMEDKNSNDEDKKM